MSTWKNNFGRTKCKPNSDLSSVTQPSRIPPETMFRKAALIVMALASLTIANANAGSAIVVSSNGYYAAAWGQFLNARSAIAKATELCQKKGGIDIKVLASRNDDPVFGMCFGSLAVSGHGPSAIVGAGYGSVPPAADGAAFLACRQRGGSSPHTVVAWKERDSVNGMLPNTRAGKF
jgi:hypothetical protein